MKWVALTAITVCCIVLQSCAGTSGFVRRKYLDGHYKQRGLTRSDHIVPIPDDSTCEITTRCIAENHVKIGSVKSASFHVNEEPRTVNMDVQLCPISDSRASTIVISDNSQTQEKLLNPDPELDAGGALEMASWCLALLVAFLLTCIIPKLIYLTIAAFFTPLLFLGSIIYIMVYYIRVWAGVYPDNQSRKMYITFGILLADVLLAILMSRMEILFWAPEYKKNRKKRRARRKIFN